MRSAVRLRPLGTTVQWLNLRRWLDANPGDELWPQLRAELDRAPGDHLVAREHLGWGVFALVSR